MPLNNPQPNRGVVAGILSGLANDPAGYVADLIPATPGPHKGTIKTFGGSSRFGIAGEDGRRAPGGSISMGPGLSIGGVDYETQPYGRAQPIADEDRDRNDPELPIALRSVALADCMEFIRVGREQRLATLLAGTTWGYVNTPGAGDRWNADTANPNEQLLTMRDEFIGGSPNVLIMAHDVWSAYKKNVNVLSSMSIGRDRALADMDFFKSAVADKLGIEHVMTWDAAVKANANPDDQSDLVRLFAGKVWMGRIGTLPGTTSGSTVVVQPTAFARVVEREPWETVYRKEDISSDVVKVELREVLTAVTTDLGARLDAVLG